MKPPLKTLLLCATIGYGALLFNDAKWRRRVEKERAKAKVAARADGWRDAMNQNFVLAAKNRMWEGRSNVWAWIGDCLTHDQVAPTQEKRDAALEMMGVGVTRAWNVRTFWLPDPYLWTNQGGFGRMGVGMAVEKERFEHEKLP